MKKDNQIKNAIDESLGSVRFNANDMRSVLRAVREEESMPRMTARKPRRSFQPIFAAMTAALVIVPLSILAVRTVRSGSSITTITPLSANTAAPNADPIISVTGDPIIASIPAATAQPTLAPFSLRAGAPTQDDAIQIARACFEANCDTDVFSFEEYTVSVQSTFDYGDDPSSSDFEVTMHSVYDNGCAFTVVVDGQDGSVLSFSTPRLATVPTRLNAQSEEIQAWYDQYGEYIFMWPLEMQAEFSRRYEGALLRTPREGEVDAQTIANRFGPHAYPLTEQTGEGNISYHIMLYDGQSFADGQARYHVYCFPGDTAAGALPDIYMLLTFLAADGSYESGEILSTSDL